MTNRTKLTTKKAIKGILIFTMASLFPVAVLLADARPLDSTEIKRIEIERSVRQWKGLRSNLDDVLKKANRLSQYQVAR